MKKQYTRKVIGTSIMTFVIAFLTLIGASYAQAQFLDLSKIVNVDGMVDSISQTSLRIHTNGTDPITFIINRRTVFPGNLTYRDFAPGELVRVIAKTNKYGNLSTAKVIKKIDSPGDCYGHGGEYVFVRSAKITAIGNDTITVSTNLTHITFRITSSTWFVNTSFNQLSVGDRIQINGNDSGSEFVTRAVFKYPH